MKVQFDIPTSLRTTKLGQPVQSGNDFRSHLQEALSEVNTLQQQGDAAYAQLLTGDIEFHDAMIMAEQANLALQLTMTIRTKLLEAYQEIMRMQV